MSLSFSGPISTGKPETIRGAGQSVQETQGASLFGLVQRLVHIDVLGIPLSHAGPTVGGMSNSVVIGLLIAAGVFTLAGNVTVAINYATGARIGRELEKELQDESRWREANPTLAILENTVAGEINLDPIQRHLADLRDRIAHYLRPRPILIAGLTYFAIGTILDTVAGVGALLR